MGSYHGLHPPAWAAATLITLSPKSTLASDLLFTYGTLRKPKTGIGHCVPTFPLTVPPYADRTETLQTSAIHRP